MDKILIYPLKSKGLAKCIKMPFCPFFLPFRQRKDERKCIFVVKKVEESLEA